MRARPTHVSVGTALAAVALLSGLVSAACPYPLGPFAAAGHIQTWNWSGNVTNLETEIVEATLVHGQKSFGMVVNAAGQLHFLYDDEVEYELPDGEPAETQAIYYKEYSNATGWDVPILDLSDPDVHNERPEGRNVAPYATAFGATMWAVWEVSGNPINPANGSYVMLRGKSPAGFTETRQVSYNLTDASNKLSKIVTMSDKTFIAFQTNEGQRDSLEYRIAGRTWDGTTLGPLESISGPNDGWSDQVVTLASDGTRVAAAWMTLNTTDLAGEGNWDVMLSVRDGVGSWSLPVTLSGANRSAAKTPAVAFYGGGVVVMWASDDPEVSVNGEYDLALRSFDPALGTMSAVSTPLGSDFTGQEQDPSLYTWPTAEGGDGKLHLVFSSNSSPRGVGSSGSENDIFYGIFDGANFSPILLVSDPLDNGFIDLLPGFFTADGGLFAYYLANICLPGCGHETDWREMTRLLARPERSYDDVSASYILPAGNHTTSLLVNFTHADGSPASGDGYMVKLPNGTIYVLTLDHGLVTVPIEYNGSLARQLTATYCGAPVATTEFQAPPPHPNSTAPPTSNNGVVLGLVAVLAAVAVVGLALWTRKPKQGGP
jgi:hypothetical protein